MCFERKGGVYLFTGWPTSPPDPVDTVLVAEYEGPWKALTAAETRLPPPDFYVPE